MRTAPVARKTPPALVARDSAQHADETVQNEVMPCRHIVHLIWRFAQWRTKQLRAAVEEFARRVKPEKKTKG